MEIEIRDFNETLSSKEKKELNKDLHMQLLKLVKRDVRENQMFEKIKLNPFATIINGLEKYGFVDDGDGWDYSPKTRKTCAYCLSLYDQNLIDLKYEPGNDFSSRYQQWKYINCDGITKYIRACTMVGQGTVNLFQVVNKLPYSKCLNINTMEIENNGYPSGASFKQ